MGLDNPLHIAFLVVILLLVFGARRLPEIGRSLGEGMKGFKDGITGHDRASLTPGEQAQQAVPPPPPAPPASTEPPSPVSAGEPRAR